MVWAVVLVALLLAAMPAAALAAGPFTVNTTSDTHCTGFVSQGAPGCTAATDSGGHISLRSALEEASTAGGTTTITLPAGTYDLSLGDLVAGTQANTSIKIQGAGAASTTINQTTAGRMVVVVNFNVNANAVFELDSVTVSGGSENENDPDGFGGNGGAILAGGSASAPGNAVTLDGDVFSGNYCSPVSNAGCSGGAISMTGGGNLTVSNSTFSGNTAAKNKGFGAGGAIYFDNGANGGNVSITGSTFTNNTAQGNSTTGGQGGGVRLAGGAGSTYTLTGNTFTGNAANGTAAAGAHGAAIYLSLGSLTATFNRIVGNTSADSSGLYVANNNGSIGTATNNWWGCNSGPGAAPCDTAVLGTPNQGGSMTDSPWIVLKTTASPSSVDYGASTTLTTSFLQNSSGGSLASADISQLIGLPVTWANVAHGSLSGQQSSVQSGGTATATFTAGSASADCGAVGKAEAKVDAVPDGDSTATPTITINCPDLTATKTNDVSGSTQLAQSSACPPQCWTWSVHVANSGGATATFANGSTILTDNLPNTNVSYGTVAVVTTGVTGTVSCSIDGSDNLGCSASGQVQIPVGASFTVSFRATPTATATFGNPRSGGTCAVDPGSVIPETSDANNTCSDSVTVTAPDLTVVKSDNVSGAATVGSNWTWKLHAANSSPSATATFTTGQTILTDDLDTSGHLTYGTPIAGNGTNITGIANVSCSIASNTLTCTATGTVVIGTSGSFDVSFTAKSDAIGTYTNPRSGGSCGVDPNGVVPEGNEANNSCNGDSVTVTAPDLTVTKSDNVSGATTLGNNWSWTLHVANDGGAAATVATGQTILTDDLDNGGNLTFGTPTAGTSTNVTNLGSVSCSIVSSTLTCMATGTVTIGASGSFDVTFTVTPSAIGTYTNPRAGGTCAVDPSGVVTESDETNNNCNGDTVTVTAPDLATSQSNNVGGQVVQGQGWNWTVHIANTGNAGAVFTPGTTLLRDDLDNTVGGVTYGSPSVLNASGVTNSGSIQCSINGSSTLTCTANGGTVTVPAGTSFDVQIPATSIQPGTYINPRSGGICRADPNNSITESNESNNDCTPDSVTAVPPVDLTATKSDDVGGSTAFPGGWTWKIKVANQGSSDGAFTTGQTILADNLPASGLTYGSVTVSGQTAITGTGTISCQIASNDLTCTATGGSVTIGASTGSFDVSFSATPTAAGTFKNPPASGSCAVDPNNVIPEASESNNSCSDTVNVLAPDLTAVKTNDTSGVATLPAGWNWKVHVANGGTAAATFSSGQTILTDDLPSGSISYGTASVANESGITGTVSCSISSGTLTCIASGGAVTIAASTGAFEVSFAATATAVGAFANPRAGGVCAVDPNGVIAEPDTANNSCSDTVNAVAADLSVLKTDTVSGSTTLGNSWTWNLHVANGGSGAATFTSGQTILTDDLPTANINYGTVSVANQTGITGTVSCSITSGTLTCTASGGPVTIGSATGAFDVSFSTTPTAIGTYGNPRSGGSCSVDPNNVITETSESNNGCSDTVTVTAPDLTATKTDDVSGTTTLGNPWSWKVHVANAGNANATFSSGQTILSDNLPAANIRYGTPTVANQTGITGAGTVACRLTGSDLTCTASGGPVTIASTTGSLDVTIPATPTATGTYANPRAGGTCAVDPAGAILESDETNNSCNDTVTTVGPPTATISAPTDGGRYKEGAKITARYSCSDAPGGPGIASCTGTVPNGRPIETIRPGLHAFTITATSTDGLRTTSTRHYTVLARSRPFNRFIVTGITVARNGVVHFHITVPGPGVMDVLETAWKHDLAAADTAADTGRGRQVLQPLPGRFVFARAHRTPTAASILNVTVTPNIRGKYLVAHHQPHRITIRLWITYRPTGGSTSRQGFLGLVLAP